MHPHLKYGNLTICRAEEACTLMMHECVKHSISGRCIHPHLEMWGPDHLPSRGGVHTDDARGTQIQDVACIGQLVLRFDGDDAVAL